MGDLVVHANEVRNCKACYQRVVWLKTVTTDTRCSMFQIRNGENRG